MDYIYSRVSTEEQTTDAQLVGLIEKYPNSSIIHEIASGAKHRPKLNALIGILKPGDRLIIAALDRLGRRTIEILSLMDDLHKRGITLISVREGLDYSTIAGRLVASILAAVAQMERELISERTKAGLKAARARGKVLGRAGVDASILDAIEELTEQSCSKASIAQQLKISLATVYKYSR